MLKLPSNNPILFLIKVVFTAFVSFFFLLGCGSSGNLGNDYKNVYTATFFSDDGTVLHKLEVPKGQSFEVPLSP
ncbi:MAG: hypothetical protein LBQ18_00565, partial [Campylobacteraceae bacterium]|nr:hypothetical protein [Campylobacteraceae bacterium]